MKECQHVGVCRNICFVSFSHFLCHVQVTRGVNVKNIGQVVTERLNALRRLTVDPDDSAAMNAAYAAQQKVCLIYRIITELYK